MLRKCLFFALSLSLLLLLGCKGCNKGEPDFENVVDFDDLVLERCDNKEDDNGDGLVDCEDPACQIQDACVFEPPDPASLAPPIDGALGGFAGSVQFLWEGDNPVVRGVDADALDLGRVAVVRTQLLDRDGNPSKGVRARIAGRPELGYTFSRDDGVIDLVANGGEPVMVRVGGGDFLTVDRQVEPERLSYGWAEDIVMTRLEEKSTAVEFKAKRQVAAGSAMTDDSGSRTARLYFPPGTDVVAHLPDGQRGRLDKATIRLTEYTVGEPGLSAMPAWLPDESAYTYAVELSVDEARAAGADEVRFSRPVYLYLDNFLDFAVGTVVPSGFYLRNAYRWDPSPNGIVMRRTADGVSIAGQTTADGATREALGITKEELDVIAQMFDTGDTFWRVPVEHFSPCDLNWPYEFPEDAVSPDELAAIPSTRDDDPCAEAGSRIECQNRVMSKSISLPGAPVDLVYRTDRVAGSGRRFVFPLTGTEVPASLEKVVITVDLAGRYWRTEYDPAPNLEHEFEWDGLDAYGRNVDGKWPIKVAVGFFYEVSYTEPPRSERAFAQNGGEIVGDGRRILPIWRNYRDLFGSFDALGEHRLGGWSFDSLHAYDAARQVLYPGGAPEIKASTTGRMLRVLDRFLDPQELPFDPKEYVVSAIDVVAAPDDSLIFQLRAVVGSSALIKRHRDGRLEHLAGKLVSPEDFQASGCFQGCDMDGPATDAVFPGWGLFVDGEGTPYVNEGTCVYAVRDNALQLLDDCHDYERPDGSDNELPSLNSFVVTDDGDLIMAGSSRIVRIRRGSRFVERLAGCSQSECPRASFSPADGRAVDVRPDHLTLAPNGDIYFADWNDGAVGVLDRAGRVRLVVAPEDDTELRALDFGRDGRLYGAVLREFALELSVLSGNGWQVIAGADPRDLDPLSGFWSVLVGDGEPVPATSTALFSFGSVTADAAGRVYFGSLVKNPDPDAEPTVIPGLMEVGTVFGPTIVGDGEVLIPARRGDQLHRFDDRGRHLATLDSVTLAPLFTFERDADGVVRAVVDADGNRTTVERAGGALRAIEGPWGHRVEFATDATGYITSVTMPDGASASASLGFEGLIETWTDARGEAWQYQYDSVGRLERADDPAGGFKILRRLPSGAVELETASGRQVSYGGVDPLTRESVVIDAAGLEWRTRRIFNTWTQRTQPDGTMIKAVMRSDPRFGILAGYVGERTTTLPSGLEDEQLRTMSYTAADASDLGSVLTLSETLTFGDDVWTSEYDVASRTLTQTSPEGRQVVLRHDDQRRIIGEQIGGFSETAYLYDDTGALVAVEQGGRRLQITYGADGFPSRYESEAGAVELSYDAMGRVASYTDSVATHAVTRDVRGDALSTGFAGARSYTRTFDPVRRPATFATPDGATQALTWDADRHIESVTRPSGRSVVLERDPAHRLVEITTPEGTHARTYGETTGLLTRATSPGVTEEMTYDGMYVTGRTTTVEGVSVALQRRLGDRFRITRQTIDGQHVDFAHDRDGLYTVVGPVTLELGADAPIAERIEVGGITTTLTYDATGALIGTAHEGPDGALFAEDYDAGRVQNLTETVFGAAATYAYGYDAAGRLTDVARDGANAGAYSYDRSGHRIAIDGDMVTYDAGGRTTAVGATTFSWDADGFLAGIDDGTPLSLTYDTLGQLERAERGGQVVEYRYNPRGHRVARLVDDALERIWVYDDTSRPVAELDASGRLVARFVYASSGIVPDAMLMDGRTYRIIRDRRYSVRLIVDAANGQVVQQLDYDALGRVVLDTNPGFQPFGFAGGLVDELTGLVHMGRRDYDPRSGRWTTPDPGGFTDPSTGLYQYAIGDPINFIDPDGGAVFFVFAAAGVIAAGGVSIWNQHIAVARDAGRQARARYWGEGGSAGAQNQLRHCTGQCEYARKYGTTMAEVSGAYHELPVDFLPGAGGSDNTDDNPARRVDRAADLIANACGRDLADESPDERCIDLCQNAIDSGRLPVPHEVHWKDDMGNLDVRARRGMRMRTQAGGL